MQFEVAVKEKTCTTCKETRDSSCFSHNTLIKDFTDGVETVAVKIRKRKRRCPRFQSKRRHVTNAKKPGILLALQSM
jgi:hypothetical protein